MRLFERAINVYDEGLRKFPQSLDLAYNKARAQYEIATHPVLLKQLPGPVLKFLEIALDSHRYALQLDPENPDTLFNTAQVLTSIAEHLIENEQDSTSTAMCLLEEALDLQSKCLAVQEAKFEEDEALRRKITSQSEEPPVSEQASESDRISQTSSDDQLAAIVEPVTRDTLIDTALAQLDTLKALCEAISISPAQVSTSTLPVVVELSTKLLRLKLPSYASSSTERLSDIALTKATFTSALLEAEFRTSKIDAETYKRERDTVFMLEPSVPTLLADAHSLMSFATALQESSNPASNVLLIWIGLTTAISQLRAASTIPGIDHDDVVQTHALRGDCSLLQYQLGRPPIQYGPAIKNESQVLNNAVVFYRNASKLSYDIEQQGIMLLRSAVASGLLSHEVEGEIMRAVGNRPQEWIKARINDMVDENLLSEEFRPQ